MIDQLFNWLNTVIVLGFGIYIFKRSIQPGIRDAIKIQYFFVKNLQDTHKQLKLEQQKISKEIEDQELFCEELTDKVKLWNSVFQETTVKKIEETKTQHEKLLMKYKMQLDNRSEEIVKKQIVPNLIANLKNELAVYYGKTEKQHAYLDATLNYVAKADHE